MLAIAASRIVSAKRRTDGRASGSASGGSAAVRSQSVSYLIENRTLRISREQHGARLGVAEDKLHLGCGRSGIHGNHHHAGGEAAEIRNVPLGAVGGPNRNAVAFFKTEFQ